MRLFAGLRRRLMAPRCKECGGLMSRQSFHHQFFYTPDGIETLDEQQPAALLSCSVPMWCCDDCDNAVHAEDAAQVIAAAIRRHQNQTGVAGR